MQSYFSKFSFIFYLKGHHTKDVNLNFQLNWSNHLAVVSNFVYYSCPYNYYITGAYPGGALGASAYRATKGVPKKEEKGKGKQKRGKIEKGR